jgi:hypothetical protein
MTVLLITMTVTLYFDPTNVGGSVLQVKTSLCRSLSPVQSPFSSLASHKKITFQTLDITAGTRSSSSNEDFRAVSVTIFLSVVWNCFCRKQRGLFIEGR